MVRLLFPVVAAGGNRWKFLIWGDSTVTRAVRYQECSLGVGGIDGVQLWTDFDLPFCFESFRLDAKCATASFVWHMCK